MGVVVGAVSIALGFGQMLFSYCEPKEMSLPPTVEGAPVQQGPLQQPAPAAMTGQVCCHVATYHLLIHLFRVHFFHKKHYNY